MIGLSLRHPLLAVLAAAALAACDRQPVLTGPSPVAPDPTPSASVVSGPCVRGTPPASGGTTNTATFIVFNDGCSYATAFMINNTGAVWNRQSLPPQFFGYFQAPPETGWKVCFGPDTTQTVPTSPCWQGPPLPPYVQTVPIPIYIYTPPPPRPQCTIVTIGTGIHAKIVNSCKSRFKVRTHSVVMGVRG
jgi:hypothetical protein